MSGGVAEGAAPDSQRGPFAGSDESCTCVNPNRKAETYATATLEVRSCRYSRK